MKMHPFIFQSAMACANVENIKTETRRNSFPNKKGTQALAIVNKNPDEWMLQHQLEFFSGQQASFTFSPVKGNGNSIVVNTGLDAGDLFYQRESCYYDQTTLTWRYDEGSIYPQDDTEVVNTDHEIFRAPTYPLDWTGHRDRVNGIHMPRCAARYFGEITGIYAERLQMMTEVNAQREGIVYHPASNEYCCDGHSAPTAKLCFKLLWESIYTKKSYKVNPWVVVIRYRRVEMPGGWPDKKITM